MGERIGMLSIEPVQTRQAPKTSFGAVLANGASRASGATLGVAAPWLPGGATLSAAVSHVARAAAAGVGGGGAVPGSAGAGSPLETGPSATAGSESPASEGLQGQRELMLDNRQWTTEYLALQNEMQRESREFSALSNILKVRHESAKTAINNIR